MKAGHSKLDGYSAILPATRPSPRLPKVVAPLPPPSPCEKPHGLIPHPFPHTSHRNIRGASQEAAASPAVPLTPSAPAPWALPAAKSPLPADKGAAPD